MQCTPRIFGSGLLFALALGCSSDESRKGKPADAGTAIDGAAEGGSGGNDSGGSAGADGSGGDGAGAGGSAGAGGTQPGAGGSGGDGGAGTGGDSGAAGTAGAAGSDPLIASGQNQPTGIALGDDEIYWANQGDGAIVKCPRAGCGAAAPTVVTSGHPGVQGVALHGSTLYWTSRYEADGGLASEVMKCDVGACGSGVPAEPNPGPRGAFGPYGLAVNDARVYVTAWNDLLSCPLAGCGAAAPTSLTSLSAGIMDIALNASDFYVIRRGASAIHACPLAGCSGTEPALVSNLRAALALAIDTTNLYWSHYQYQGTIDLGGAIRTCPLAGCDPASATVIVAGEIGPAGIAVDGPNLYYTDHLNGRVVRTSKTESSNACEPSHFLPCGSCGGVTRCDGSCTVVTPANFGTACRACGTIQCDGNCSMIDCP